MKLRHLFMAVIAGAFAFTSCEEDIDLGFAKLSLDPLELNFGPEENSASISIIATRDWKVTTELPDWISLSATSGQADIKPQTITVTVLENKGNDRETTIHLLANTEKGDLVVKQKGALGELKKGSGTKEDPYTVAGVIEYLETLGADVNSPNKVYVKGKVASIKEEYAAQYGNANFDITDNGEVGDVKFTCYRILYLGNKKWAEGDTQIKVGDDVVIFGNVVNYKGNTPETQQGSAFLFSLNGVDKGGDDNSGQGQTGEAKGAGTEADPFNVAAAIAKAKEVGQTESAEAYYIKGKVAKVNEAFGAQYGNGSFELVDEGFDAVFTAYRILYFGNKKWAEGDKSVKEGDELVVVGKIVNFKGNTPETSQGSGYLYSLNGEKGTTTPPAEETKAAPAGDGSQSNPFNVSAAIDKAKEVGETATEKDFYVKGKVAGITEQFGAQYGNGTFVLVDEGYTAKFTAYRILYLNNQKWVEGDATVAEGDELVAVGKIVNFKGNTPEITQGGYLYSLNGKTSIEQGPVFGVEKTQITVSGNATSAVVKVTGNVAWTASTGIANLTLSPTSGQGAGEITATFPANNTEGVVTYSLIVKTDADVARKEIEVLIAQNPASAGDMGEVLWDKTQLAAAADKGAENKMDDFISFTNSSSYTGSVTELRIYKGQTLTIKASNGATIQQIEIQSTASGTANQGPGNFTTTSGEYKYEDKYGQWNGDASEVVLKAESAQVRIIELKVHYTK